MHYYSTRGQDGPLGYEDALLSGLARDGGLYLPETWPKFSHEDISANARVIICRACRADYGAILCW
jgi:threonine synthase